MDLQLAEKKVLVTGASKGIGRACAQAFAAEGAQVVLVSRTEDLLQEAVQDIRAKGQQADFLVADLSRPFSAEDIAAQVPDVDILVNNAGAIPQGDLMSVDEETWRTAWDLKVFGFINLTRAFYRQMKARQGGVIVNIIGAAATTHAPGYVCGAAGNAALEAFTRSAGSKSLDDNIRILGISPGSTETDRMVRRMEQVAEARLGDRAKWRELLATLPQGRAGTVEEVAQAALFFASPQSSYTTGTVMRLDGGQSYR